VEFSGRPEYGREADLLGAQIMSRAGHDVRQMANMFRTIQQRGGGNGPEWLSDHPDPGNRYAAINREASMPSGHCRIPHPGLRITTP
jgi:predicted Zn-dependent protease